MLPRDRSSSGSSGDGHLIRTESEETKGDRTVSRRFRRSALTFDVARGSGFDSAALSKSSVARVRPESEKSMSPITELQEQLDRAGMASEDKLGRALDVSWIPAVPYVINTVDATPEALALLPRGPRKRYAGGPWLQWVESVDRLCNPLPTDMRGMLDAFLRLWRGTASDVEEFVFKWGSLEFCGHLRAGHCEPMEEPHPDGFRTIRWEPVECYRDHSAHYQTLLELCADLTAGGRGSDGQWRKVLRYASDDQLEFVFLEEFGRLNPLLFPPIDRDAVLQKIRASAVEKFAFGQFVSWEMQQDPVALGFEWPQRSASEPRRPRIGFTGRTLGVLSYQLAVVMQGGLFSVCSNCQKSYAPKRKPQLGRDNYCEACAEVRKTAYKARARATRVETAINEESKA